MGESRRFYLTHWQGWTSVVLPDCQSLADEDTDGELTVEPSSGVPEESVRIAVDRATRALDATWSDEGEVSEVELDLATALTAGETGALTLLETPHKDVELALAAPIDDFDGVAPGDVIVGIGPMTLEFFAVQVDEEEA